MKTLLKELSEIDFHKERIRLIPLIIENKNLETEFWDLYLKINPEGNLHLTDTLLEARTFQKNQIKFFSEEFAISENFLKQKGIDPYPITAKELEELETEFPEIFRRRTLSWILKLFTGNKNPAQ